MSHNKAQKAEKFTKTILCFLCLFVAKDFDE